MTDVLFGQSYYLRFDPKLWRAMQPYPPLGTLYAAAVVREAGYSVGLFDAMLAESEAEWVSALDQHTPRVAVLYEDNFNYLSKMSLLRMREAARARRPCWTCWPRSCAPRQTRCTSPPPSRASPRAPPAARLSAPCRAQPSKTSTPCRCPRGTWSIGRATAPRGNSVNMVTTRGCPFHCNWCAKPIWGQRYAVRSPKSVVDEMRWLRDHVQPDHVWFMDDIMGIQDKWIESFADELDRQGVHIPFKSLNRVDLLLRGKTIPALARAGAKIVWVGAESGSQKILDAMDKGTQVEQIYEAARQLHAHGVGVAFFLQFGYPGETRADIDLTLKMVHDLLPDDIGISVSYPLPGTPFYERVKLELGERANWVDSEDLAMLYKGPFKTAFYRQLHTVIHKAYRSRKTWVSLRGGRWAGVRAVGAMLYHQLTLPLATRKLRGLEAQDA
ncbi:MAG: B12-binding domain-containing radical SAM protein [Anaerolineae bacterium]|nr:B12-binding domain-containing radical SAM protein [Anaerolineae bacterium]